MKHKLFSGYVLLFALMFSAEFTSLFYLIPNPIKPAQITLITPGTPLSLPSPTPTYLLTETPTTIAPGTVVPCALPTFTVPTLAATPGYAELDPSTGLHYTGKAQTIDLASYRMVIDGMVDYPLKLSYDDLRCMPKIEVQTTIVCKGNFDDTAVWAGASLKYVLELAGIQAQAKNIRLISADGYSPSVSREDAMSGKAFLAYEWEKQAVPIIHGFPVRAAFPGLLGANWVKGILSLPIC
jgi:DMSO/TMAO reductase YedYZ molybdopterin-dependent catalytic subunit